MTHARDNFLAWLRAAHAMEEQAITTLSAQSRRIESYPDLKARIVQHLHETEEHAEALKTLLDRFSGAGGVLAIKDIAAKLTARAQGVGGKLRLRAYGDRELPRSDRRRRRAGRDGGKGNL
jgi:ferritin-like metal-binding protein YciE